MKHLILNRTTLQSDPTGTLGELILNGKIICQTLERPWKDNQKEISCIPVGEYVCKRIISPKFGETFEITGVPNRTHILFHSGNDAIRDSHGCVLLGMISSRNGSYQIFKSRIARDKLMEIMKDEQEFKLTINQRINS